MYISKFSKQFSQLAARALGSQLKAPLTSAPRTSCAYLPRNHDFFPLQHGAFFSTTAANASEEGNEEKQKISVTFVDKDGEEQNIKVPLGTSMLEAAHENDIELEGACEGSLACSTCHVIVMDMEYYNKLEEPTDEENDMLDLAFGLTETSRLGCQVIAKPELDGIRLAIPAASRNMAVDGYKPKPH
ncbi:oxidoreductase [Lithospermum erythrorhizon]|uniref:Oxidoreductase n=1 Tax=Lithospermum erythrorhizon TaxID=34254 RepID=A0AAV3R8I9_LITER